MAVDTELEDDFDEEALDEEGLESDDDASEQEGDDVGGEEEDDEGTDDGEEGGKGQVEQPAKRGRANDTIRSLRRENQDYRRRLEDLERQSRQQPQRQQQIDPVEQARREEAERQRVALMTPEERFEYRMDQMQRQNQQFLQGVQMNLAEQTDKANFEAKSSVDPLYKKYAPLVEQRLSELRAQGQNVPREVLMKFMIGERALQKADGARSRQTKRAQSEARQQRGRATNPRGRQGSEGRSGGKSAKDRLEGVKF